MKQEEKRYQLLSAYEDRPGKCMDCAQNITVEVRIYLDKETNQQVMARVRSTCFCKKEHDPYAGK